MGKLRLKKDLKTINLILVSSMITLFLTLFLVGTFKDLQISQSIGNKDSFYGVLFDYFGFVAPSTYAMIIVCLTFNFWKQKKKLKYILPLEVLTYLLVVGIFTYLLIDDVDFKKTNDLWSFVINALVYLSIYAIIIYFFNSKFNKIEYNKEFAFRIIIALVFILLMTLTTEVLKNIFNRPRPRSVLEGDVIYREWWNISYSGVGGKSFPSGHTTAAILIISMALIFKDQKIKTMFIILGLSQAILVGMSRVVITAHFLSDIAMGALISTTFYLLTEELIMPKILRRVNHGK
ncbi:phosphatase PAP2 family protein [Mesoplasma photuris]|uniref:phosphatase PAP2 family protein n=1 Tax=Mesoplasma photuris TaxID=217731 RepID=UPI0004E0E78A|nr:phosphatase PAP2 family protein [Mesoplasma photuris]